MLCSLCTVAGKGRPAGRCTVADRDRLGALVSDEELRSRSQGPGLPVEDGLLSPVRCKLHGCVCRWDNFQPALVPGDIPRLHGGEACVGHGIRRN